MIKTFERKKQFSSYLVKLNSEQTDIIMGKDKEFYGSSNESLISELIKLKGVEDAWLDFRHVKKEMHGLTIRVSGDKDNKKLWTQIESLINKTLMPT